MQQLQYIRQPNHLRATDNNKPAEPTVVAAAYNVSLSRCIQKIAQAAQVRMRRVNLVYDGSGRGYFADTTSCQADLQPSAGVLEPTD